MPPQAEAGSVPALTPRVTNAKLCAALACTYQAPQDDAKAWRPQAYPVGQRPGVRGKAVRSWLSRLGVPDTLHRAGQPLGERIPSTRHARRHSRGNIEIPLRTRSNSPSSVLLGVFRARYAASKVLESVLGNA